MMTPNLSSSFLSFPTQSSPRLSIHLHRRPSNSSQTQNQNSPSASHSHSHSPFRDISYPHQRRKPTPIDLYALPTLEALPTPPSTSSQSHLSFNGSSDDKPRRLKKAPSQGELTGRIMRSFTKTRNEKEKEKDKDKSNQKNKDKDQKVNTSFLPFDTDPPASASRRPSLPTQQQLPRPPTGMSSRSKPRPTPLDPSIFGHRLQIVKAEDPIDMVLRLDSEARVQAITRSFSPFGAELAPPPRPPPLDPSVFGGREMKVVRAEDPIDTVLRLEEESKMRAMKKSFTPFGSDQASTKVQRSRGQSVGQGPDRPVPRATEPRTGSVRQRNHGPMPSIQGVIEGDDLRTDRERRDSMQSPMMAPPSAAMPLRRSPTSNNFQGNRDRTQAPSPTPSTPRDFFYPRPESPRIKRSVIPGFTNRSPPSHTATIDESPTLGSIHLPEITRYKSLSPSVASGTDSAWQSNTYVDHDEERLTALGILEELNGGMEDGWEYGVLDTQRIHAGLDNRNFKQYGMVTIPYSQPTTVISTGHHKEKDGGSSIKEVANSVRSWRESRKKGRPPSEKSVKSKTASLKPKPSYDGLQPLYEVHYSIEKEMMNPPPIPPRAPGRSLPPLKIHIERVVSSGSATSGMEVPIVLDSPVKGKFTRDSSDTVRRHDIPESVILSPPTSPTPIHQRPLPPLPSASPRTRSIKSIGPSLKQTDSITRLLRAKRPNNGESPTMSHTHHSTPPAHTQPLSPLDSPPPSSPRPRLSAREEPHASLPSRLDQSFSVDRSQSRKHGMTALSFLALEDPTHSWAEKTATASSTSNRNSLDGKIHARRESTLAHIIPPEELAKMVSRRRASSESDQSRSSIVPDYYTEEQEEGVDRKAGRMSFGLSPPPRHNRRSFEPPPRVDEEDILPSSLSPPPRPRHPTRRPSDSPSTPYRHDHLQPSPSASPFVTTPSPSQSFIRSNLATPSPIKESPEHDLFEFSPTSELGHAAELKGSYESFPNSPSAVSKEMDKQALNEWLSKPRVRKASVPVHGISRRRGMLV